MAKAGKLDPVIGRDDEIRRCIQILSRRTKNNPVLIGEPGVGKTAISEGLVQFPVLFLFTPCPATSTGIYFKKSPLVPKCPSIMFMLKYFLKFHVLLLISDY